MGKSEFFEGEPLYVVFSLTNDGGDTAWIAPYDLTSWFLHGDLREQTSGQIPEWGLIADYAFPPGYRGEPLPPGAVKYQVVLIQDHWGIYRQEMQILYVGHHLLPGSYVLLPIFDVDGWRGPSMSKPLEGASLHFVVRARTGNEDLAFEDFQRLAAMSGDSAKRTAFLDSLLAVVATRAADDPLLPMLVGQFTGIARGLGFPPDSADREVLATAGSAASLAQRSTAGGATAALAVYAHRPSAFPALATELAGSLAGLVAQAWLSAHN